MRILIYLFLALGAGYAVFHYVPEETRTKTLTASGLGSFFQETLPNYLRGKLSIPENPITTREKLLSQLSTTIADVERELEAAVPVRSDGAPPPSNLPQNVVARVEKSRELLAESEAAIRELEAANSGESIVAKAAVRLLDKILPPPPAETVCSNPPESE